MKKNFTLALLIPAICLILIRPGISNAAPVCSDRKISLDLQDTDVDNAFRILSEVCNKNIVLDPEVKGKVTLRVIDVSADNVLETMLKQSRLEMEIKRGTKGEIEVIRVKNAP